MKIILTILGILLAVILLVLLLIGIILLLPVTIIVKYNENTQFYKIRIAGYELKKGKKKRIRLKKSKNKQPTAQAQEEKLLDQLKDVREILPPLLKHALKIFEIEKLELNINVACGDPCDTAIIYGTVNGAVYSLIELVETKLRIRKKNIRITADYTGDKTSTELDVVFYTSVYKAVYAIFMLSYEEIIEISI